MKIYNLDLNEEIDILRIWWKDYKIWDIKPKTIEEILKLPTIFIWHKKFLQKWREIIIWILEVKNDEIDLSIISEKHIMQIIEIISKKIKNGERKI